MRACLFVVAGARQGARASLLATRPDLTWGASPSLDLPEEPPGTEANAVEPVNLNFLTMRQNISDETNSSSRPSLANSTVSPDLHDENATADSAPFPERGLQAQHQLRMQAFLHQMQDSAKSPPLLRREPTPSLLVDMPLLLFPACGLAGLVLVLVALVRSMLSGEADWTRQLVSRTEWSGLERSRGVVKCEGSCEPVGSLTSPLAGVNCVAYSLSVAYEDAGANSWVTCKQESAAATLVVRDSAGRGLLVSGKECHPYRLGQVKEWYFPSTEVPEPFASWVPADVASRGRPLRFREELLSAGSAVTCVGAVSPLRAVVGGESHTCLRPAYAVVLAQGQRLDWAQLVDLGPAEWTQLAARVLVTNANACEKL